MFTSVIVRPSTALSSIATALAALRGSSRSAANGSRTSCRPRTQPAGADVAHGRSEVEAARAEQADEADQDQVQRDDEVEQLRHDQNQDAGDQRDERRE